MQHRCCGLEQALSLLARPGQARPAASQGDPGPAWPFPRCISLSVG